MRRSPLRIKSESAKKILPLVRGGKELSGHSDKIHEILPLEQIVSHSLARLVNVPSEHIDKEIRAILRQILDSCRFDRCGLMQLNREKTGARATHLCHQEEVAAPQGSFIFSDTFPWSGENLLNGDIVCFSTLSDLPSRAEVDRRHYRAMGVESCLTIPIYVGGTVEFFIYAHHLRAGQNWPKENISMLRMIGEVFVNHLVHCREKRDVDVRLQFEQLISDLSVRFINTSPVEVEQEIMAALEMVREIFQFDRFGLLTFSPEKTEVMITHACYGEGISRLPEKVDISTLFPWATERLLRGETVYFTSLDELPEEVSVDRQSWKTFGVKANFTVPIQVSGSVEYLIAGSNVQASRSLNTVNFPRMKLLGEIFVNALVRCKAETILRNSFAEIKILKDKLQLETEYLKSEIMFSQRHEKIIGQSEALARTLVLAEQVAPTDSTVLITGETGTGKELIARAIHELGTRCNKPMVKVNCASLPAALVESELFGREKGAYTGALTRQSGRFEIADGATIFLDEIAEMSVELQAKLLRVLQEGQFERLGSTKTIQVDVRVITATNRNLAEEVKKGKFREDLYYRLNVFQIVVPPLRDRIEDIPMLVWAFVNEFGEKMGKKINKVSRQDMTALQRYSWPGNVRELRNVIEYGVIVSHGDRLQIRLPEASAEEAPGILKLAEAEARQIRQALLLTGWRIKGEGGAASLLGVNPSTLYSRMQKFGISNRQIKDEMSP